MSTHAEVALEFVFRKKHSVPLLRAYSMVELLVSSLLANC